MNDEYDISSMSNLSSLDENIIEELDKSINKSVTIQSNENDINLNFNSLEDISKLSKFNESCIMNDVEQKFMEDFINNNFNFNNSLNYYFNKKTNVKIKSIKINYLIFLEKLIKNLNLKELTLTSFDYQSYYFAFGFENGIIWFFNRDKKSYSTITGDDKSKINLLKFNNKGNFLVSINDNSLINIIDSKNESIIKNVDDYLDYKIKSINNFFNNTFYLLIEDYGIEKINFYDMFYSYYFIKKALVFNFKRFLRVDIISVDNLECLISVENDVDNSIYLKIYMIDPYIKEIYKIKIDNRSNINFIVNSKILSKQDELKIFLEYENKIKLFIFEFVDEIYQLKELKILEIKIINYRLLYIFNNILLFQNKQNELLLCDYNNLDNIFNEGVLNEIPFKNKYFHNDNNSNLYIINKSCLLVQIKILNFQQIINDLKSKNKMDEGLQLYINIIKGNYIILSNLNLENENIKIFMNNFYLQHIKGLENVIDEISKIIEFYIESNSFDFLFNEIINYFLDMDLIEYFFSYLEYFIKNNRVTFIPKNKLSYIIDNYKKVNKIDIINHLIIGLNLKNLDVDELIFICLEKELYYSLFYICISMEEPDYISPIMKLFNIINNYNTNENWFDMKMINKLNLILWYWETIIKRKFLGKIIKISTEDYNYLIEWFLNKVILEKLFKYNEINTLYIINLLINEENLYLIGKYKNNKLNIESFITYIEEILNYKNNIFILLTTCLTLKNIKLDVNYFKKYLDSLTSYLKQEEIKNIFYYNQISEVISNNFDNNLIKKYELNFYDLSILPAILELNLINEKYDDIFANYYKYINKNNKYFIFEFIKKNINNFEIKNLFLLNAKNLFSFSYIFFVEILKNLKNNSEFLKKILLNFENYKMLQIKLINNIFDDNDDNSEINSEIMNYLFILYSQTNENKKCIKLIKEYKINYSTLSLDIIENNEVLSYLYLVLGNLEKLIALNNITFFQKYQCEIEKHINLFKKYNLFDKLVQIYIKLKDNNLFRFLNKYLNVFEMEKYYNLNYFFSYYIINKNILKLFFYIRTTETSKFNHNKIDLLKKGKKEKIIKNKEKLDKNNEKLDIKDEKLEENTIIRPYKKNDNLDIINDKIEKIFEYFVFFGEDLESYRGNEYNDINFNFNNTHFYDNSNREIDENIVNKLDSFDNYFEYHDTYLIN